MFPFSIAHLGEDALRALAQERAGSGAQPPVVLAIGAQARRTGAHGKSVRAADGLAAHAIEGALERAARQGAPVRRRTAARIWVRQAGDGARKVGAAQRVHGSQLFQPRPGGPADGRRLRELRAPRGGKNSSRNRRSASASEGGPARWTGSSTSWKHGWSRLFEPASQAKVPQIPDAAGRPHDDMRAVAESEQALAPRARLRRLRSRRSRNAGFA